MDTRSVEETSLNDDDFSTIRNRAEDSDDDAEFVYEEGNYSTRMDEIFSENGDGEGMLENGSDDGDEEGFFYTGVDAEPAPVGYQEQLKDVLGAELDDNESEEERIVEKSLIHDTEGSSHSTGSAQHDVPTSNHTLSTSSAPPSMSFSPVRISSPGPNDGTPPQKSVRPFMHPTISRLRSFVPHPPTNRMPSASSFGTFQSYTQDLMPPSPSHFSAISQTPSVSDLNASSQKLESEREAFRWTVLGQLGEYIYIRKSDKAKAVLGSPFLGSPTVLTANGLICVGTDAGFVYVFDFKQQLKCTCGDQTSAGPFGPVTALALSHDHTYVAVGHAYGHIQLFDINRPHPPARTVNPTSLAAVSSGRQEGHLFGSRIVRLGFISGRHTAIVSADDQGLAFYHSLGKVLFIEANDVLRVLGKYPDEDPIPPPVLKQLSSGTGTPKTTTRNGSNPEHLPQHQRHPQRKANTILSMAPLPLGTSPHPTDSYHLIALLTPFKLVVVGLKPSPKTWFRRHREGEDDANHSGSQWKGCLSWFPSINVTNRGDEVDVAPARSAKKRQANDKVESTSTTPFLAYSWARTLNLFRISERRTVQKVRNQKTGNLDTVETGKVIFEEHGSLILKNDILAIEWLNANQIVVFTAATLDVYDVRYLKLVESASFDSHTLISPSLSLTSSDAFAYQDSVDDIAQSVRVYKGKIFVLGHSDFKVGTLLSWADRILSFVQEGDFLSAIDLTRAYYLGEATGNKNGLPDDVAAMRRVVGEKMSELMIASARYAFSDERFTDATHVTPDNRGVDRTSLFEGLVSTCARACIALNDVDFLFEELFQWYENSGILSIYLKQLEPFVLDSSIHYVPPRITQRLVAMHQEDGHLDDVERIIWHIDPECLDINQAISLCQEHQLYDALIYVYTKALHDYVSPIVELLGLVRKVQQRRKEWSSHDDVSGTSYTSGMQSMESIVPNAYKVYAYLANILSGLTYPSEKPMPEEESLQAQRDVHTFLFYGRSSVWPAGDGGRLVLTADEEGGTEPTYPYVRLLLRFDAEAFLSSLDVAFEHGYLNDDTQGVSRQIIVKILLEIMASPGSSLSSSDITFIHIFLARNIPKYPQFLNITPTSLQGILIGLAMDTDQSTREDRQLAAEYLLSVYTPDDNAQILHLFEEAGFFRIIRSWHRQERQWAPLIETYLQDPELHSQDIFEPIGEVLAASLRPNKQTLPQEVLVTILDALPQLLQSSIPQTALLLDQYTPSSHSKVIHSFEENADHKRLAYLRCLLGPPLTVDYGETHIARREGPSLHVDMSLRQLYITLLCRLDSSKVIDAVKYLPPDFLDGESVVRICEEENVYEAVVWVLNERHDPLGALTKIEEYSGDLTARSVEWFMHSKEQTARGTITIQTLISRLESMGRMGIAVCLQHSQPSVSAEVPLEDLWFKLLSCQIDSVQTISGTLAIAGSLPTSEGYVSEELGIASLRILVQDTFASLVSVSSTKAVSFPRLFKRLVDSTAHSRASTGTPYTEFRTILMGMLESYRSESDLLLITKHLVERDLFSTMDSLLDERMKGWMPTSATCASCGQPILGSKGAEKNENAKFIVVRTGVVYHDRCLPAEFSTHNVP